MDVFFVISGFLITSIIAREKRAGTFSLGGFYARRIRRILPALLVVVVASLVAGYVLLVPSDLAALGSQAASAAFGVSNFYFFGNTGYFDRAAELQPLLHSWSLGVEEQFYLVWPALFLLVWRIGRGSIRMIVVAAAIIGIVSLGLSVLTTPESPQTAFYMPHTRAFELALGGLVALLPAVRLRWLAALMSTLGVAVVVASAFALDDDMPFPGWIALIPCLGAALVVWPTAHRTAAARLLGFRPLVFVGLTSYSIYLWHWPLLVFFRHYAYGAEPSAIEAAILLAATFALSVLTWRLVEVPFRRMGARPAKAIGLGLLAAASIAAAGLVILWQAGLPFRIPEEAGRYVAYLDERRPALGIVDCFEQTRPDGAGGFENDCLLLPPGSDARVLVIGDSHATHYSLALTSAFPDVRFAGLFETGCRPVVQPQRSPSSTTRCEEGMSRFFEFILPRLQLDTIVISARWSNGDADQIRETVDYVGQFADRVIVLGQTLEYRTDVPVALVEQGLPRRNVPLTDLSRYDAMREIDVEMRRLLAGSGAEYYSPLEALCPVGRDSCRVLTDDGIPFQRDYGHFTMAGAAEIIAIFRAQGFAL